VKFGERKAQERKGAARLEMYTEQLIHGTSFDDEGFGCRSLCAGLRRPRIIPAESQVRRYHRQNAFPTRGGTISRPVPEDLHEIGKKFSRSPVTELNVARRSVSARMIPQE
jgi:hypothetical protein